MVSTLSKGRGPCIARCGAMLAVFVAVLLVQLGSALAQQYTSEAYRITAGDKIAITVFGQPELSGEFILDQSGNLRLPIVGDIPAADLTPSELEVRIARSLEQGYIRKAVISVRISDFRPIHVVGLVRAPGVYSYRQGISVLGAIAQAGGIGVSETRQGSLIGELLQSEERVRLLEASRAALTARRVRLIAQQSGSDEISFPDWSAAIADSARMAQIMDGELRMFSTERESQQQETELLRRQIPLLKSEIYALQDQKTLEENQRQLNNELAADYERLMKTGLMRKPTYIEIKREEARIEGNIARLAGESLKAELAIGEIEFKIGELHNNYRRRLISELQETDRALLELSITLPSAQRTRVARAHQIGMLNAEDSQQPAIVVFRLKDNTNVRLEASLDVPLQPGDIVQVGSLFPSAVNLPAAQTSATDGEPGARSTSSGSSLGLLQKGPAAPAASFDRDADNETSR
jgi:polysaccharide export outer membrane protein